MHQFAMRLTAFCWFACLFFVVDTHAVRIMTLSDDTSPMPVRFDNFTFADPNTIIATGQSATTGADRVFSIPVPADPNTDTVTATQLSTRSFLVNAYDVAFEPVVSPNGLTILYTHDGSSTAINSIYKMPITGEASASSFTGLFGADPNPSTPGDGSSNPVYSPDGTKIYFINNNSGFQGSIPIFSSTPTPWGDPDWDQIYSIPAGGGAITAVTAPGDGDIDAGLFALTPDGSSFVYAPDNPISTISKRGAIRPKLYSISSSGGASTEIPVPAPAHDFSFGRQLEVTADGQTVIFIGDYDTLGKQELYSVPITGGTPTRLNDDLPFAGDVTSFAISPDGASIAYVAGQNTSSNHELFLKSITGAGTSIRVSDPAPSNSGVFDVSNSIEAGQFRFSADGSQIYYLGDLTTDVTNDLYVVDLSEKTGLVPSPYYFVGAADGDFFDENNWNDMSDGSGNSAPTASIDPGASIYLSLIIDGDSVGSSGGEADFGEGSSLELTSGSTLTFSLGGNLDFNPNSGFKLTDATVNVATDIFLEGTNFLNGGSISAGDDLEFSDAFTAVINGTMISAEDNVFFENSATSVTGASILSSDRLGMRYEVDVTVTDTDIIVLGESSVDPGGLGHGDIEDAFTGGVGNGSTLTLQGGSTLLANALQDGVSLALDDTSIATMRNDPGGHDLDPPEGFDVVDPNGQVIFLSVGAELVLTFGNAHDVRDLIINGLTGLSYADDPNAWNVTDWDGLSALPSLKLAGLPGDFDFDMDVDGMDFLIWQRGGSPNPLSASDLADWEANYGAQPLQALSNVASVPEPTGILLLTSALMSTCLTRRRKKCFMER